LPILDYDEYEYYPFLDEWREIFTLWDRKIRLYVKVKDFDVSPQCKILLGEKLCDLTLLELLSTDPCKYFEQRHISLKQLKKIKKCVQNMLDRANYFVNSDFDATIEKYSDALAGYFHNISYKLFLLMLAYKKDHNLSIIEISSVLNISMVTVKKILKKEPISINWDSWALQSLGKYICDNYFIVTKEKLLKALITRKKWDISNRLFYYNLLKAIINDGKVIFIDGEYIFGCSKPIAMKIYKKVKIKVDKLKSHNKHNRVSYLKRELALNSQLKSLFKSKGQIEDLLNYVLVKEKELLKK